MKTFFAPAERAPHAELLREVELISNNPIIDTMMNALGALFAVVNQQRQILALNNELLTMMGIDNPQEVLGLRPGEAINCIHSHDEPGGCGTSEHCMSCGAAIAMVTSLHLDKPAERTCAVTIDKDNKNIDLFLTVRTCPVTIQGTQLLLLFLKDVTRQQYRASLERVFYHDVRNILMGLVGVSELLEEQSDEKTKPLARSVYDLSLRLRQEVEMQRVLASDRLTEYQPIIRQLSIDHLLLDLQAMFVKHPAATSRHLLIPEDKSGLTVCSDHSILLRVLSNMITNALEAGSDPAEVKVTMETLNSTVTFVVWNPESIPPVVSKKIFQRNYSTKPGEGRGLGTYSMKLFGEEILHGKVGFTSSEQDGTKFWLQIPR